MLCYILRQSYTLLQCLHLAVQHVANPRLYHSIYRHYVNSLSLTPKQHRFVSPEMEKKKDKTSCKSREVI